jgi:hypothetical protein
MCGNVGDPGCLTRIPDSNFPSRIPGPTFFIPDPGSASKNFNPKKWFLSSRKYDRIVHPVSGSRLFTHPGSRGQKGTGSRIRIRNTELCREELVMLDQNYYPGQQRGVRQLLEQAAFQAALLNRNWHRRNCTVPYFLTSGTGPVTC